MANNIRSVPDRDVLRPGVRVQLSYVQRDPYFRRADLDVADRLAVVVAREGDAWRVRDDAGEEHRLQASTLEAAEPDPATGRWRIAGAIPAYGTGDRLRLHWRHRSPARPPDPPRADCDATVVAEAADTVTARLDDGTEILLYRWGGQADEPDRRAPRWFVIRRVVSTRARRELAALLDRRLPAVGSRLTVWMAELAHPRPLADQVGHVVELELPAVLESALAVRVDELYRLATFAWAILPEDAAALDPAAAAAEVRDRLAEALVRYLGGGNAANLERARRLLEEQAPGLHIGPCELVRESEAPPSQRLDDALARAGLGTYASRGPHRALAL